MIIYLQRRLSFLNRIRNYKDFVVKQVKNWFFDSYSFKEPKNIIPMKKYLLLFMLLLTSYCVQAQFPGEFKAYFYSSPRPCLVDSTQMVNQFDEWDFYKTTNNEWNGTLDSTFCGEVKVDGTIDLTSIGDGETFFIRYHFNDTNKIFAYQNELFAAGLVSFVDSINQINLGNNCNGNFCTSVMLGLEIPDSLGTGTDIRWHETIPTQAYNYASDSFTAHFCLPTENVASNHLREIVAKITVGNPYNQTSVDKPYGHIKFKGFSMDHLYALTIENNINIPKNSNGDYIRHVNEHLLLTRSNSSGYPNIYNVEYMDVTPYPTNVDTVVIMNIIIEKDASFIQQPFLELQGAYLLNSTTQRHNYNIINNGGNVCFPHIVEVILKDGNHYIHKGGNVDFGGKTACMQFGEGSKLIIDDNAHLEYGTNGVGNLALRTGSSIEIRKNAELHINNNVMLFEFKYDTEPQQVYMTLNEGSKLSFGKLANITNEYSLDGTMKLNIYMKGGEVDLSQLDPASRALINLIYDTPTTIFSDNIQILGNPIKENVRISIVNDEAKEVAVRLTSVNGQLVYNNLIEVQKGYDEIQIPTLNLANGLYFVTIQSNEKVFTDKVIIFK